MVRKRGGWAQFLAKQLTLSQPGGTDYAHQMILAPSDFQNFRRPWDIVGQRRKSNHEISEKITLQFPQKV